MRAFLIPFLSEMFPYFNFLGLEESKYPSTFLKKYFPENVRDERHLCFSLSGVVAYAQADPKQVSSQEFRKIMVKVFLKR